MRISLRQIFQNPFPYEIRSFPHRIFKTYPIDCIRSYNRSENISCAGTLEDLLAIAAYVKAQYGMVVRVNTNGLSDLIHGKDTTPMFAGKVDIVSISLNTPDKEEYYRLTRNKFGEESFDGMLRFAENVKKYVPKVVLTTVETTITREEEEKCLQICDKLGVTYRIRQWED